MRFIINFYFIFSDDNNLRPYVSELVEGPGGVNNLFLLLHVKEERLSPTRTLKISSQVASACAYLHSVPPNGIVHRDIKSSNVLVDRRYNAKVTDFGCSKLRRTLRTTMSIDRGTVNWSAPEVLRGKAEHQRISFSITSHHKYMLSFILSHIMSH